MTAVPKRPPSEMTMTSTVEYEVLTFDFGYCVGPVPAHRHRNPDGSVGGWCANTARVDASAWVSGKAQVFGEARVSGEAWVSEEARVSGEAHVFGEARVSGEAWVFGKAQVFGEAWVSGEARVSGEAQVIQVGPVGSRNAMLTVYATKDGPRCTTGCFEDHTLAELLAACEETHGADAVHTRNYRLLATAAFTFIAANAK